MLAFIDGGTTNSRVYLFENGKIISEGFKNVGEKDLANGILKIQDTNIFPFDIPVYFIRGVKNKINKDNSTIHDLRKLDFMRGEEVQVIGILENLKPELPVNIMIIGSHTKLIHVDKNGKIAGSITTISGQFYEALINCTFIGKCIVDDGDLKGLYSLDEVINVASEAIEKGGLLRAMIMPRFMQVLMNTTTLDRKNFINACIASEEFKILDEAEEQGFTTNTDYYLFGNKHVCEIYKRLLTKRFSEKCVVYQLTNKTQIRDLTISGSLAIVRESGVLDEIL